MKFNETQLKWIEENKELINNRNLDKLRPKILYEDIENYEKRQLLVGLAIIFDLPMEILRTRKTNSPQTFYPLYINGMGDRIKLAEWGCLGEPSKGNVLEGIHNKLISNGIDGKLLQEVMRRVEYNVD